MPRKWGKGPRSVIANSVRSLEMTNWMRLVELAVSMMSSTYNKIYEVAVEVCRINKEESAFDA
jgi:hypothetical protein